MEVLNSVLILGIIIRPVQIIAMTYLSYIQWKELRNVTPYQTVKKILLSLFVTNGLVYAFSLFIDLVGIFHWFVKQDLAFLVGYLGVNLLSATLVTILLLVIYKVRVKES